MVSNQIELAELIIYLDVGSWEAQSVLDMCLVVLLTGPHIQQNDFVGTFINRRQLSWIGALSELLDGVKGHVRIMVFLALSDVAGQHVVCDAAEVLSFESGHSD
jgi:hypothetical protein